MTRASCGDLRYLGLILSRVTLYHCSLVQSASFLSGREGKMWPYISDVGPKHDSREAG